MIKKTRTKKSDAQKKQELLDEGIVVAVDRYRTNPMLKIIIQWFREGLSDKEVVMQIMQTNPRITESTAISYFRSAKHCFNEEYNLERKFNIAQHVKRYDKDILFLSKFQPRTSSYAKGIMEKTEAYLNMITLLQKKEKVLGFHRPTTKVKIKNTLNVVLKPTEKMFDLSALSWEEKLDLYRLVNKSEVNPHEKMELKPNPNKKVVVAEDTTFEEIQEDVTTNIELIPEKPDTEQIFEFEDIPLPPQANKNIIDARSTIDSGKNLDAIKNNILGNLFKS